MSQYSFNLDNPQERLTARRVLDAVDPMNVQTGETFQSVANDVQSEGNRNVEYTDSDLQQIFEENDKLKQQIKELEGEHKKDLERINEFRSKLSDKDGEVKKWNDCARSYEKQTKEKDSQIASLKEEVTKITNERDSLQRRLESYEPSLIGADGEEQYFKISDSGCLTQTYSVDAPYKAKVSSNGKASYQFNTEKGPCQDACNNRDQYIRPFCDIEEEFPDATSVRPSTWGKAELNSNDELKIIVRAKVKLVKL